MPSSIVPNLKCRMCLKMNPPGSRFCNYCGNDLTFSIQPDGLLPVGAVLRGSYVVEGVIGEGGMGVVYSCHHKSLGTRYALKVLDPKLARMDVLRRRFLAEARIQAEVVHPHIVHVMDVIDSDKDGGIPGILAIVMEYVEGSALDRILERSPLSIHDAVSSTLVILDAIGFAHHKGVIHRDLKPSNIMVSRQEAQETLYRGIKVMDFGIAKILSENEQRTVTGAKMGTPRYMAPEQIENARDVDERTDLYAIGLTLYELLCGRTPFESYKEFELLKAQLSMKPPSMRAFRSDIPDRLESIVMKSLEKDRANRYPNAESFQRALLSLGGYDEIALRLNPQEGILVSSGNQKLQRKIERAIDRNKAKESVDGTSEKAVRRAPRRRGTQGGSPSKVGVFDGQVHVSTKDAAGVKDTDAPKSQRGHDASPSQFAAFAETELKEKSRSARSSKQDKTLLSGSHSLARESESSACDGRPLHATRKATKRELSSTSQRAMRRVRSAAHLSGQFQNSQSKTNDDRKSRVNVRGKGENDVVHSSIARVPGVGSTPKVSKSVSAVPSDVLPGAAERSEGGLRRQTTRISGRSQAVVRSGGEESRVVEEGLSVKDLSGKLSENRAARRSPVALKAVFGLIAILCLVGVSYRWWNQMPDSVAPHSAALPGELPGGEEEVLPDISRIALVERQTDTGRMTVIPKAEHWISTGNQNEISRRALGAFAIDQVEVSHYQYGKCVAAKVCPPLSVVPDDWNMPVTHIGYGSAETFCHFAGKQLPTVEQWEAAARFGGDTDGITGVNVTCETVHCGSGKGGECRKTNPPHPESVFHRMNGANPGHLLNMLGNVREWTSTEGKEKQMRVTKGGSYLTPKKFIQISAQEETRANEGASDLGFRCVIAL